MQIKRVEPSRGAIGLGVRIGDCIACLASVARFILSSRRAAGRSAGREGQEARREGGVAPEAWGRASKTLQFAQRSYANRATKSSYMGTSSLPNAQVSLRVSNESRDYSIPLAIESCNLITCPPKRRPRRRRDNALKA
jgi:hypothetical protein